MKTGLRTFCIATLAALFALGGTAFGYEKVTYIHFDALGSPAAATNEQGAVVWRESYQPYGERIRNQSAAADNSRWYTGHPQDTETGLVYAGARYYDPLVGRFMAIDAVAFTESNFHSFNRYAYVANNPYKYIDPDGNFLMFVHEAHGNLPQGYTERAARGQMAALSVTVATVPVATVGVMAAPEIATATGTRALVARASVLAADLNTRVMTTAITTKIAVDNGVSRATTAVGNGMARVGTWVSDTVGRVLASPVATNPDTQQKAIDFTTSAFPGTPAPNWAGVGGAATGKAISPEEAFR